MKVYIILKEDHGYLGYGTEIGSGTEIESIHRTFEDAWWHLQGTYKNVFDMQDYKELISGDLKGIYRYFDENDEHAYEFWVYEKELA